ncbi:polymorphic toxin-type HINT domain-containing protein [Kutzneria sp. NPDC052558]|uniref:polymorphic toxin-type HINT domain-containing protein n=1 Tax=Kutzneria sp. NPDC052558 TaxID=3364121 RepID=UPI0037C4F081
MASAGGRRARLRRARVVVNLLVVVLVVAVFGPTVAQVTPPLFGDLHALADALSLAPRQHWGSAEDAANQLPGEHDHVVATTAGNQQAARGLLADYPAITFPAAKAKANTASVSVGPTSARGFDPATSKKDPAQGGRYETTYRNADGTQTTEFSKDPVNYRKPDGSWQPIDTGLVPDGNGWRNASDEVSSRFAGQAGSNGMVSFGLDRDHVFGYGLDGARPVAGQVEGSTVTYPGVLADTDMRLDVQPGGVKESLVLASRNAPHSFLFPLQLKGLTAKLVDGRIALVDASGAERASVPAGSMSDSSRNPHTGDPATSTGVAYHLVPGGLRIDLDQNWLNDPARAYPVVVDPTVLPVGSSASMYVQNGVQNDGGTELKTGFDGDDNIHAATYLKFDGIENTLRNVKVFGAKLWMVNDWAWSCVPSPVYVHAVTSPWSNNPTYGPELSESSFAHGYIASGHSKSDCPVAGEGIDLGPAGRDVVQAWVNGTMPNYGLTVRGSDTDSYGWKKFTGTRTANPPKLFVTYTRVNADYNITQPVPAPPVTRTESGQIKITVTNRGADAWSHDGYALGYRVYSAGGGLVGTVEAAQLPGDVARGQSVDLTATIQPLQPGDYYLDFSMFQRNGPMFTDEQIPPARLMLHVYDIAPVIGEQYPPNGYSAPTLTPQLWAHGVDIDALPGSTLQYRFEVCERDSAGNAVNCFDSGHISSQTWTVPTGKLVWSKTYVWRVFAFDGNSESPKLPDSALFESVPQPEITSHLGNAPYSTDNNDFDPQVGNFFRSAVDASLATSGPSISVARTYNSLDPRRNLAFGEGWATQYDMSALPDNDNSGNVLVTYPDGQQVRFGLNPDGSYAAPAGRYAVLTHPTSAEWDLVDKAGATYRIVNGHLASLKDSHGQQIVLDYTNNRLSAVHQPPVAGRTPQGISFTWTGSHVTSVTTSPGGSTLLTWTYTYDGDKLTKVCDPRGGCTVYNYESGTHYRSTVLDTKPDSYWRLGDPAGAGAATSQVGINLGADQGKYKDVTLGTAGPTTASTAATFNGTSSAVTLPNGVLRKNRDMAVELWFRTTTGGPLVGYQNQPLGGDTAPTAAAPMLYVGTDGKLRGQLWTGHIAPITTLGTVNDGKWHHVALTGALTTQLMYLDGQLVGQLNGAIDALDMTDNQLGADFIVNPGDWPGTTGGQWQHFTGDLAEAAYYEHPIGQPSIAAHVAAAAGADELDKITLPSGKVAATVTYDLPDDRVHQYTDSNGGLWTLGVPAINGTPDNPIKVTSVIDPGGRTHEYDYDPLRGRIVRFVAPLGVGIRPEDRPVDPTTPTTTTDTCTTPTDGGPILCGGPVGGGGGTTGGVVDGGGVRTYTYDSAGFQSTVTDENGDQVSLGYDKRGNTVSRKTCRTAQTDCQTAYFSYFLNSDNQTDPRNDKLTESRDARSANATDDTYKTTNTYNAAGQLATQTTPDGAVVTHTYTTGRESINPSTGMSGTQTGICPCAPPGLVLTSTDAIGAVTTYSYDVTGYLMQVTAPTGMATRYTYDGLGRTLTRTQVSDSQPAGVTTTYTYDALSRLATVTEPATTDAVTGVKHTLQATLGYDADGNVTSTRVDDLTGGDKTRTSTNSYDGHDRLIKHTDPAGNSTSYGYDSFGNRVWTVDPAGTKTKYLYTARNQVAEVLVAAWTGDPVGAVAAPGGDGAAADTTPHDDLVLRSYAYDLGGRLVRASDAMGRTLNYTYYANDLTHQVIAKDFHNPNGTTKDLVLQDYSYDAAGNVVKSVTGDGKVTTTTSYDPVGRISSTTIDPDILARTTHYTYDLNGNITRVDRTGNSSNIGDLTPTVNEVVDYGYDAAGRQTSQSVHNGTSLLTTSYGYDQRNLVVSVTDPRGNVAGADRAAFTTNYGYDEQGQQVSTTLPPVAAESKGGTPATVRPMSQLGLDSFGEPVELKDPVGDISHVGYDADGRVVTQSGPVYTPPGGTAITPTSTTTYDVDGRVSATTDPRGNVTGYNYDQLGRLVQRHDPGNRTSVFQYDHDGELLQATDPGGATTTWTYDDLGRTITSTQVERSSQPGAFTTKYGYDNLGNTISIESPKGETVGFSYDALSEMVTYTDAAKVATQFGYDLSGRQVLASDAKGRKHWTSYDQAGRPVSTSDWKDGGTRLRGTSAGFDPAGDLVSATDALGHTATFDYDAAGRLTRQTVPTTDTDSISQTFGYDADSRLTRSTDGRGNSTITGYNSLGLPETVTDPATKTQPASTWTAGYDAAGNQISLAAPGGVTTTSSFDELNRLTKQTGAGAEAPTTDRVLGYNDAGRIKTVSAPGGDITINYDDRGDVLSATGGGGNASFTYDADGRMTTRADASGTARYSYDKGRVSGMTDAATGVLETPQYDEAGDVSGVLYSSGQNRTYGYDDLDRLTSDTLKTAVGTVTSSIGYGYDLNDNLTQKTTTGTTGAGTNTYTYDFADRMKSWTAGSTTTQYNWDAAGNRIQAGGKTATFDERNRLLSDGDYTYTYTPRGTLASRTSSGLTENMSFDAFDRLASDGHNTYTYDGLDRVATRNGSAMSYSGPSSALASDGTTNFSRSPDGSLLSTAQGNDKQLAVSDAHGDVVGGFQPGDGNTGLSRSTSYDPFGQVTSSSGAKSSAGFQGAYTDPDSGQVDMNARWYTPGTGTFASRDTVDGNRYAYGNSAPLNYTDPDGHSPLMCDGRPCDVCVTQVGTSSDHCGGGGGGGGGGSGGSSCGGSTDPSQLVSCENGCGDSGGGDYQLDAYCLGDSGDGGSASGTIGQSGGSGYLPGKCNTNCGSRGGSSRPAPPDPAIAARAAEKRAAENNPIPIPSAMYQPFYAQQSEVVSTTPDLPAQQVSQLQNPVSDIDKSYAAMQAKLVADQGPVVQNVSAAVQQASASSGDFWGNVGDAAASAVKFVWDGITTPLMDAYHCLHSVVTTLDVLIAHGRWQPNNGYGPEYEYCASTAIDIGLMAVTPELNLVKPLLNSPALESLLKGARGAVGPAVGGVLDTAINGIPGLKNLFGKAEDGLSSALCALFNSFTASTPVEMADGSQKPISDVHVGDQVLATDPTTGQSADKPVTDVIVGQGLKHLVDVTVVDPDGGQGSVTATSNHPFWVDSQKTWINAGNLKTGERLRTDDGHSVTVTGLHTHDETTQVYNLTVDGTHTYYVGTGDAQVLVHNAGCFDPTKTGAGLPKFTPKGPTSGTGVAADGRTYNLISGNKLNDARLIDIINDKLQKKGILKGSSTSARASDVEQKFAAIMIRDGIDSGDVIINNPDGPCRQQLGCDAVLDALLDKKTLTVHWPDGSGGWLSKPYGGH